MEHNVYSVRNQQGLAAVYKQHGIRTILHLGKDLELPASRWNIRHLIAYRLLVRPPVDFLPHIKTEHHLECPVCCHHDDNRSQQLDRARTETLLGDTPRDFCVKSEGELMQLPDGFFWVALARAARSGPAEPAKDYSRRERRPAEQRNYISSTDAIDGSSSPTQPSSSEYEASSSFVDEDAHEERRGKPEEVTVHLVTMFLQHALSLCLLQHPAGQTAETEMRPRVERMMQTAQIAGLFKISAEDDGGICKMVRRGQQWRVYDPYIALIEAKRAFAHIHYDEISGLNNLDISNETLAQYLGEAVITWKSNKELFRDGVCLIAATNTFVRFMHFRFGCDYMEYLDASNEQAQIELIENKDKETTVSMESTTWFNLQSKGGRKLALCHILALLKRHDSTEEGRSDFDDQSSGDMETDD